MVEYDTWVEERTHLGRKIKTTRFECDCGRSLRAERTECDKCGAHYEYKDKEIVQIAPPIRGFSDSG